MFLRFALVLSPVVMLASCAREHPGSQSAAIGGSAGAASSSEMDPVDVPIEGASAAEAGVFDDGNQAFELPFRDADGLGPLYVRPACGACHAGGVRGPGLVEKMAVVEADGVTASVDQGKLPWGHTVRALLAAGATTPIAPPLDASVKVTTRIGPPLLGRGYLEAIDDAEIERAEADQGARDDAIHGRINRVTFASDANPDTSVHTHAKGDAGLVGRFGVKARIATLDDFVADAFQGDMGMTSPMRPIELPNPDGLTDDARPGIDVPIDVVNTVATFVRLLAIPRRAAPAPGAREVFEGARCAVCHVPSMRTRADYPIAALRGIDAPVFTDLLLHDMGPALADGLTDGSATSLEMRTAPLIGLRFDRAFLHDGRAKSVSEAIALHDGQAAESAALFRALDEADRALLVAYVESL